MPQRKPLEQLNNDEKSQIKELEEKFPILFRKYLELDQISKSVNGNEYRFDEEELEILEEGKKFEGILYSSNIQGPSFVKLYRGMVKQRMSAKKAVESAAPEDYVDHRTLSRYIDESFIEYARRKRIEQSSVQFIISNTIKFKTKIFEFASRKIDIIREINQVLNKNKWTIKTTKKFVMQDMVKDEEIPFYEACEIFRDYSNKSSILSDTKYYYEKIQFKFEKLFAYFPYLEDFKRRGCLGILFDIKDDKVFFSEEFFKEIENDIDLYNNNFSPSYYNGLFCELTDSNSELLDNDTIATIRRFDEYLAFLNSVRNDKNLHEDEMREFKDLFFFSGRHDYWPSHQIISLENKISYIGKREINFFHEVEEALERIYYEAERMVIHPDTLITMFKYAIHEKGLPNNELWTYIRILENYVYMMENYSGNQYLEE